MYLFTVLACLVIDKAVFSHGYTNEKCCRSGEYLKETDNTYNCTENVSKRFDVLTNETNFLERGVDGECVDATPEFSIFKVVAGQPVGVRPFEEPYFPKCCPLNYTYNTVLHSCEERENATHWYIRETFVKVGLPDCKVIVDFHLNEENASDLYARIVDIRRHSEYCVDENENGTFTMRECRMDTDICDRIRCVKKCCPDGQSFINGPHCRDTYTNGLNLRSSSVVDSPEDPFVVISNHTCKKIYLMSERRYVFRLAKDGSFVYWMNFTNSFISEGINHPNSYCFEHSGGKKANGFFFFKCYPEKPIKEKFIYTLVPKIMSCVFLLLTILIYFILNETRSLFGKILMNYCISTLMLFSILTYAQKKLDTSDTTCKLIGYSLIFTSTVSFAWLNVMCCDIWWTFGSTKQSVGVYQRRKDLKKLLYYLIYGWGMPTLLTLIIFFFSEKKILPYVIQPFVGTNICFIENRPNNYGAIIFLRLPHFLIQLVNTALFFKTILYCLRIKNEINKINDTTKSEKKSSFNKDKERLSLILKLAIIMGVTYIFDVMSSFVEMSKMGIIPQYIEIIWDIINCLQGVFIFIIFICKRKIYYDFLRRMKIGRARSTFSKQSITSTTRMSTMNSTRKSTRSIM
ncbi:probable G-protein coupled receptor Mth-like 6 isoform X2 [Anoplophora glabripennis]|uniref:probable G-protein coupled receptor Mth-like 6 isoform X2 n=1 Tax=Anoplophora glabripennis TaxID=217634 RepID=UPI000873C1E4|nr:probable G-protein coupled receptor Mth-like 6 isoform X2 [Anoplophora glabripennis]